MRVPGPRASAACLAATFLLGLIAAPALADGQQPKEKDSRRKLKEATFTTSVSPATAKPGETVTYTVTAKIEDGWHIYAYKKEQPESAPIATQFDVFGTDGLGLVGDWKPSAEPEVKREPAYDAPVEYYEGTVSWSIQVKVPADAKPGKKTLKNQINFMICDPNNCLPPTKTTVPEATVTVSSKGSAMAPPGPRSALASLSVAALADGQPKEKDSRRKLKQAAFTTSVSPATAKPGDTVTYTVTAKIEDGWHVYAYKAKQAEEAPIATQFDFFDKAGLSPEGEWTPSEKPEVKKDPGFKDPIEYHEKTVSWSLKLKVPADAKPGKVTLKNQVNFQICNDTGCLPPTKTTLPDASVTVTGGSSWLGPIGPRTALALVAVAQAGAAAAPVAKASGDVGAAIDGGLLAFLAYSALGGLVALLMPCVWPMVPITVNFFVKQGGEKKGSGLGLAVVYCLAIVGIYTTLGLVVTFAKGASGASDLGNNAWLNLIMGLVFIALGLSLLGLFEIRLPNFLLNATSQREGQGGLVGVMFMAATLTITSFTCTAPVVGSLLGLATKGQVFYPVVGMLTFSAVLALPFFVLALVPGLLHKMPRSGDWMNAVKVVGGLVEIGAAFKFLNTAEISFGTTPDNAWIDSTVILTAWVVLSLVAGIYLLGLFRTDHDLDAPKVGPARLMMGVLFLGVSLYLAPALFGNPPQSRFYNQIAGILPKDTDNLDSARRGSRETLTKVADLLATPGTRSGDAPARRGSPRCRGRPRRTTRRRPSARRSGTTASSGG